jgi:hypothetical protein
MSNDQNPSIDQPTILWIDPGNKCGMSVVNGVIYQSMQVTVLPTSLTVGQDYFAYGGQIRVVLQDDCNLVVYADGTAVWASNTSQFNGMGTPMAFIQDGVLIVGVNMDNYVTFGTESTPGDTLFLTYNGYLGVMNYNTKNVYWLSTINPQGWSVSQDSGSYSGQANTNNDGSTTWFSPTQSNTGPIGQLTGNDMSGQEYSYLSYNQNVTHYGDTYAGYNVGSSFSMWSSQQTEIVGMAVLSNGCPSGLIQSPKNFVIIGSEVPNANTLVSPPSNAPAGSGFVLYNPNNYPLPSSEPSPTEDLFLYMATKYNYLADGAKKVFDDSPTQMTYDYTSWSQQDVDEWEDLCSNAYKNMLNTEDYAKELFATQYGADSINDALGIGSCSTYQDGDISDNWFQDSRSDTQSTTGCSSVAVNAGMSLIMQSQLTCTVINIFNQIVMNQEYDQLVNITIEDTVFQDDVNINIDQQMDTDTQFINFSSTEVQKQLSSTMETNINQLQEAVQESLTESQYDSADFMDTYNPGQPQQGQKIWQAVTNAICNSAASLSIQDLVQTTIGDMFYKQEANLVLKNATFLGTTNININQQMITQMVVESTVTSVMIEIMSQAGLASITTDQSATQKKTQITTVQGFGFFFLLLSIASLYCIVAPFTRSGKDKKEDSNDKGSSSDSPTNKDTCIQVFMYSGIGPLALFIITLIFWITKGGWSYLTSWIVTLTVFCVILYEYFIFKPSNPDYFPCSASDDDAKSLLDLFKPKKQQIESSTAPASQSSTAPQSSSAGAPQSSSAGAPQSSSAGAPQSSSAATT